MYTARYRFFVELNLRYTSVEVLTMCVKRFIVRSELM